MVWIQSLWGAALALGLCASSPALAADTGSMDGGAGDLLGYIGGNLSAFITDRHAEGWATTNVCAGSFCVHANRGAANGRGISVITKHANANNVFRIAKYLNASNYDNLAASPLYEQAPGKDGAELVASQSLKRGTRLGSWSPVLMVYWSFFNETSEADQNRLLTAAIDLLPRQTRELFEKQLAASGAPTVADALRKHPFESDLSPSGWVRPGTEMNGRHFILIPELMSVGNDCRPNTVFWLDNVSGLRLSTVRRVEPGEPLTVTHIDPLLPRAERHEKAHRYWRRPCTCASCSGGGGGDLMAMAQSEKRLAEIRQIQAVLVDDLLIGTKQDFISPAVLARYLDLYKEERLEARLAEAYQLAALAYNTLGYDKRGVKYANRAIQALLLEAGPDASDVAAMRVYASDPRGHYTWQKRVKKRSAQA